MYWKIATEFDCDQIPLRPATGASICGKLKMPHAHPAYRRAQRKAARMDFSERTIIGLNIRHFRGLLKTETDPAKLRTIATLLAEEEAKLATLDGPEGSTSGGPG
jgi:hypothetical protein